MRKRSTYRKRPVSTPLMVERSLCEVDVELAERMLIEAFAGGWATTKHYEGLANMRNVLTVAAAYKEAKDVLHICDAMRIPMANLRERYESSGRMGVTGEELKLLRVFADTYRDFWKRQPLALFKAACRETNIALGYDQQASQTEATVV